MRLLLSPEDTAESLSIGRTTVFKLLKEREFDAVLIGSRRLITLASVEAYIRRQLAKEGYSSDQALFRCDCGATGTDDGGES